ncbi:MAG: sulfotransferase [Pseudomonadota bacterium]
MPNHKPELEHQPEPSLSPEREASSPAVWDDAEATRVNALKLVQATYRPGLLDVFPDFFIAGPQRTGTSWLNANLKFHPALQMSEPKELHFFNYLDRKDFPKFKSDELDWYLDFFRLSASDLEVRDERMMRLYGEPFRPLRRGESTASSATLSPAVIDEVLLLNPQIKIVLMLRDPVERAWSHVKKDLGRRAEGISNVPEKKMLRFFANADQRARADYQRMIDNWQARLRPGHLFIGLFEDIAQRPAELLVDLFRFLGVAADQKYIHAKKRDSVQNASEGAAIPPDIRAHLEELLATERQAYRALRANILAVRGP